MKPVSKKIFLIFFWLPRLSGFLFVFFLSLFVIDVFQSNNDLIKIIIGICLQLIPALIVFVFIIISWQKDRLGFLLFIILGLGFIIMFRNNSWQTYVLVSAPSFFISFLFLLNDFIHQKIL